MRITTPIYDVPLWTRIDGAIAVMTGGAHGFGHAVVLSLVDAGASIAPRRFGRRRMRRDRGTRSWNEGPNRRPSYEQLGHRHVFAFASILARISDFSTLP